VKQSFAFIAVAVVSSVVTLLSFGPRPASGTTSPTHTYRCLADGLNTISVFVHNPGGTTAKWSGIGRGYDGTVLTGPVLGDLPKHSTDSFSASLSIETEVKSKSALLVTATVGSASTIQTLRCQ
jgi:hypothetical protein